MLLPMEVQLPKKNIEEMQNIADIKYMFCFLQSNKLILIESQKALELIDCILLSDCKNNNCLC